jgi:hypothetical protein
LRASIGRTISAGLTAADVVSKWTWAATLLQSSNVAWKYGVSGPFWYASGATIQVLLFAILAIEIKVEIQVTVSVDGIVPEVVSSGAVVGAGLDGSPSSETQVDTTAERGATESGTDERVQELDHVDEESPSK